MKKHLARILFILVPLFLTSGCHHIEQSIVPMNESAMPDAQDLSQNQNSDENLSANYYYLVSRMHIKNKDFNQAQKALEKAIAKDPDSFTLTRDLVSLHMRKKRENQAVSLAQNFITKNPDNVDGLLLFVKLKKEKIKENELIEILNRVLAIDPNKKETYLRLGKIYMDKENLTEAMALFKKMVKRFPKYYVGQFYLGDVYLTLKNYQAAKIQFLKSIELEQALVAPRFQLLDIYRIENTPDSTQKILDTYEQILTIEPDNYEALFGLALQYYKTGQKKKAGEIFTELSEDAGDNPRIIMSAADEFISNKKYDDAIIIFSQMLKTIPENSSLNFFLGMTYQAVEQFQKSIHHYLLVQEDHAQYKKTILSIAFLYKELNQVPTAINYLEGQQKMYPKDIDIITYLSSFYETEKQFKNAIKLLNESLVETPQNTSLMFRLGAVQDKAGLKDACILTMKELIEIDPKDASALNYLGYTYAEQGIKLDEALDLIQKAHNIKPNDGYITDSLGWVYFKKQNFKKAVEYLEKAAELTQFETIISDHLGDAYMKLDRYKNALDTFNKAISNAQNPDKDLVNKIEKKIKVIQKLIND